MAARLYIAYVYLWPYDCMFVWPSNTTLWQTPPPMGTPTLCEGQEGSFVPAQNRFASQCEHSLISSSAWWPRRCVRAHQHASRELESAGKGPGSEHICTSQNRSSAGAVQVFPQRRVLSQRLRATGGAQEQINPGTRRQWAGWERSRGDGTGRGAGAWHPLPVPAGACGVTASRAPLPRPHACPARVKAILEPNLWPSWKVWAAAPWAWDPGLLSRSAPEPKPQGRGSVPSNRHHADFPPFSDMNKTSKPTLPPFPCFLQFCNPSFLLKYSKLILKPKNRVSQLKGNCEIFNRWQEHAANAISAGVWGQICGINGRGRPRKLQLMVLLLLWAKQPL